MAELASSMPTSGGLYYAAAVLAGPKYGPLAAWVTGWSNWLVQITGAPSVDYGCGKSLLLSSALFENTGPELPMLQCFITHILILYYPQPR